MSGSRSQALSAQAEDTATVRTARVLIVDDSAYVRKALRQMLQRSPAIEVVGAARDGQEALDEVERLNPDVVTLDLIMPGMDGIAFLEAQMARRPLPVVIVSIAGESGELAFRALDAGAVDFVQKTVALATDKLYDIADELLQKVIAAAGAPVARLVLAERAGPAPARPLPQAPGRQVDAVVIGVSTGGPQALKYLIPQLPANLPVPVLVVLHMPVGYTELYAQQLDKIAPLGVHEAREGDVAAPGTVLLAPAGRHLTLRRQADGQVVAHLDTQPFDMLHRPAADVLFKSAAETFGERVLGVVMTGMGKDGREGAAWIKARGGLIFTEAEESCVVYGMPRSVVEAGLSDRAVPLERLAQAILEVV